MYPRNDTDELRAEKPKVYTCPGKAMPQPEGAPPEGFVACARAGHGCTSASETIEHDGLVETRVACSCCGQMFSSMVIPVASMVDDPMADFVPFEFKDVDGDLLTVFPAAIPGHGPGVNIRTTHAGASFPLAEIPALIAALQRAMEVSA